MIGLVQRVSQASVSVAGTQISNIGKGILLLLGVERNDSDEEIAKLVRKVSHYRMFADDEGKMNLNVQQVGGEILVVSQFTLVADTQKGNRPGFSQGASPAHGEKIYNQFVRQLGDTGVGVQTGEFGADMQVSLVNDGPVTFQFQV